MIIPVLRKIKIPRKILKYYLMKLVGKSIGPTLREVDNSSGM